MHRLGRAEGTAALAALTALERAFERLVVVARLPRPWSDAGRGGSDALDLYLTGGAATTADARYDSPDPGPVDRTSGFCVLDGASSASFDRAATLCVGELIALGLDAAETPDLRRAWATSLWWATGVPNDSDRVAVDELQSHPESSVAGRERARDSEGAALFLEYLERTRGAGGPGSLGAALLSLSASKSRADAVQWENEPDSFDVLRHTLGEKPRATAELLADFAVARAFGGDRDDGEHLPTSAWAGSFGRVRFDWSLPLSSLPRRVASSRPIEPTGSIYLWLPLDADVSKISLGLRMEWEPPVTFVWSLVEVDAQGQELRRVDVPYQEHATRVEQTLSDLQGASGVIIVGTNLGGVDLSHPFDPDWEPFEPTGCTVYVAALPPE